LPNKKLEERIEQLRNLRHNPPAADVDLILRKALADRANLVIAEAAKSVGEMRLSAAIPFLLTAFARLFEDAAKVDPKCWGKTAIVKALVQLDYSESPPFVRGLRHVQMEPVWGGQEDSALHLRANCALALVQCSDLARLEVFRYLVDAMSDSADPVRVEAVRAIHQLGGDESLLLLRLKARLGDRRPLIIGHVFDALLNLERDRAVPFVAEYLSSTEEELRDEAALALGGSRLITAVQFLIETWKHSHGEAFSSVLLRAISSSRLDEAIEFLLELVRTGTPRQFAAATDALKLHESSPDVQAAIERAKKHRSDS